jgi:hypothetical protein
LHHYPPEGGRRMPCVDSMNSRSSVWTRFLPPVYLATTRVRGVDSFGRCSPFRMNPESVVLVPITPHAGLELGSMSCDALRRLHRQPLESPT